jgi:hypothetical protein
MNGPSYESLMERAKKERAVYVRHLSARLLNSLGALFRGSAAPGGLTGARTSASEKHAQEEHTSIAVRRLKHQTAVGH